MEHKSFLNCCWRFIFLALVVFQTLPARSESAPAGESFTIHLENYFVELQGGQRVDLTIHYQYASNIAREDIPDYRAVQILVEDALYGMPTLGPYWEITNKEIVRRLLTAFPQFPRVESQFNIRPRGLLNIHRGSTVELQQSDLAEVKLLTALDQDTYYLARDGHYNILVPRPFKASLGDIMQAVKNAPDLASGTQGLIFDVPCFPLAGSEFTMDGLLAGLKPSGPYSAIVLPEKVGAARGLTKIAELGPLKGIVKILAPTGVKTGKTVAEISLADVLGMEDGERLPLGDAREKFYTGKAPAIVMEAKYALPYKLRGDAMEPYEPETQLALFAPTAPK